MDTPFGLRGVIVPSDIFKGVEEDFAIEGFQVSVKDGVLEIGYNDPSEADRARAVVADYLAAHNFASGTRFSIDLNQSWEKRPDGTKLHSVGLADTIKVTDHITVTVTQTGKARMVRHDSRHLGNQTELVRKAQTDQALRNALKYFSEEVVDDERPLYGIYKAVEELAKTLGSNGREKLGKLAGRNRAYVDEVMETTQTVRHHSGYRARKLLPEAECRERAKALIEAYARAI